MWIEGRRCRARIEYVDSATTNRASGTHRGSPISRSSHWCPWQSPALARCEPRRALRAPWPLGAGGGARSTKTAGATLKLRAGEENRPCGEVCNRDLSVGAEKPQAKDSEAQASMQEAVAQHHPPWGLCGRQLRQEGSAALAQRCSAQTPCFACRGRTPLTQAGEAEQRCRPCRRPGGGRRRSRRASARLASG